MLLKTQKVFINFDNHSSWLEGCVVNTSFIYLTDCKYVQLIYEKGYGIQTIVVIIVMQIIAVHTVIRSEVKCCVEATRGWSRWVESMIGLYNMNISVPTNRISTGNRDHQLISYQFLPTTLDRAVLLLCRP